MDWRDEKWREGMKITLDYNSMVSDFIGENGISRDEIDALLPKAGQAHEWLVKGPKGRGLPILRPAVPGHFRHKTARGRHRQKGGELRTLGNRRLRPGARRTAHRA